MRRILTRNFSNRYTGVPKRWRGKPWFHTLVVIVGLLLIAYQTTVVITPVNGAPVVISPNGDSLATAYSEGRRVLALSDGTLVTLFTSNALDANQSDRLIYWAYSKDGGASWTTVSTNLYGKSPAIVKDSSNNLYMVFEKKPLNAEGAIFFCKGSYNQTPSYSWSTPVEIDDISGSNHNPSLAADSKGNLHVVYDKHRDKGKPQVNWFYNMGANWGASWVGAQDKTQNVYKATGTAGSFPSIVIDANDNLFVTWFDGNGNFYIRRAVAGGGIWVWDGSPWASFLNVGSPDIPNSATTNAMMMHCALIKPGGGELALVLPNSNSATGYKYQFMYSPTSGAAPSWTTFTSLTGSTAGDGWPSLAGDSMGNYYIFVTDSPQSNSNIAYYKYFRYTSTLSPKLSLFTGGSGNSNYPSVMQGPLNGRLPLVWTGGTNQPTPVNFDYLSQVTLSIDSTYNMDGTKGNKSVDFSNVDPVGSQYIVSQDQSKHAIQLTVTSDVNWNLTVQAKNDLMGKLGNTIPINQLLWRNHGSSTSWTPFQTSSYLMLYNQVPTGSTSLRYDYLLNINWLNPPDLYSTILTYTISPKL